MPLLATIEGTHFDVPDYRAVCTDVNPFSVARIPSLLCQSYFLIYTTSAGSVPRSLQTRRCSPPPQGKEKEKEKEIIFIFVL